MSLSWLKDCNNQLCMYVWHFKNFTSLIQSYVWVWSLWEPTSTCQSCHYWQWLIFETTMFLKTVLGCPSLYWTESNPSSFTSTASPGIVVYLLWDILPIIFYPAVVRTPNEFLLRPQRNLILFLGSTFKSRSH